MNAKSPSAAAVIRRVRRLLGSTRSSLLATLALARAWHWGAVFGRLAVAALGLVLLGAIGRSALARSMLSTDGPKVDAGAAPPPGDPRPPAAPVTAAAIASPPAVPAVVAPPPPVAPPPAEAARGRATPDDPVFLNQATLADLHRLPGVGPKRAEAIVALRARLGHFRQVEDLMKVKGIGRSSLRKLRPLVRLDPPPAVHTADAGATPDAASG